MRGRVRGAVSLAGQARLAGQALGRTRDVQRGWHHLPLELHCDPAGRLHLRRVQVPTTIVEGGVGGGRRGGIRGEDIGLSPRHLPLERHCNPAGCHRLRRVQQTRAFEFTALNMPDFWQNARCLLMSFLRPPTSQILLLSPSPYPLPCPCANINPLSSVPPAGGTS